MTGIPMVEHEAPNLKVTAGGRAGWPATQTSRSRWLLFRLAAVSLGLLPFFVAEATLRVAGWGRADEAIDPDVDFAANHPLFQLDPQSRRFEIANSRRRFFCPDSFAADKSEREFRIFCLGGSTVQGSPYAIETSFTTFLELSLQAADDRRSWEVVNCGGISYASYRLVPILHELLDYQPDLLIIYTGHNEFLEDRACHKLKRPPAVLQAVHSWCTGFHLYHVAHRSWKDWMRQPPATPQTVLPVDVAARLDFQGGLAEYHRDDAWQENIIRHFELNLGRMVQKASAKGIPVILVDPVANLKDCPPFKYELSHNLSDLQRQRFHALWEAAKRSDGQVENAVRLLEKALTIDRRHAGAWFHLGKCYELLGRFDEARGAFVRAKDEDICPLRILEAMNEVIRKVGRRFSTPVVNIRPVLEGSCAGGLLGDEVFVDHVHPTIEGHQRIAEILTQQMADLGLTRIADNWETNRQDRFRKHLQSLDATYFLMAKERMRGQRAWTEGRVSRMRPGKRDTKAEGS